MSILSINLDGIEKLPMNILILVIAATLIGIIIWKLPDILKQWRKLK